MLFESRVFWTSKDSAFPEEYQDAFQLDPKRGIAAIADGVSSAIFSGPWARTLTQAVVLGPPLISDPEQFRGWLQEQRTVWKGQIDTSKLAWFQRPKMADGAMSTLLWIELAPENAGEAAETTSFRLVARAIGDCCLFHLRGGELQRSFPTTTSADFGLNPEVLNSSNSRYDDQIAFQTTECCCVPGDLIVLCTDAIALWAIMRYEAGETVDWEAYWDMPTEQWLDEIAAHRQSNAMRFDDSTLILLRPELTPDVPDAESPLDPACDEVATDALLARTSEPEFELAAISLEITDATIEPVVEKKAEITNDATSSEPHQAEAEVLAESPENEVSDAQSRAKRSAAARLVRKVVDTCTSVFTKDKNPDLDDG